MFCVCMCACMVVLRARALGRAWWLFLLGGVGRDGVVYGGGGRRGGGCSTGCVVCFLQHDVRFLFCLFHLLHSFSALSLSPSLLCFCYCLSYVFSQFTGYRPLLSNSINLENAELNHQVRS